MDIESAKTARSDSNALDLIGRDTGRSAFVPTVAEITIVVPTYSERDNIVELVERMRLALVGVNWEVVFVDDDSPDGTSHLAKSIAEQDCRVRCIRRVGRRGLSGACIEGALSSSSPIVAIMDADLQHDETILPLMLQRMRRGDDLVIASRYVEGGASEQGFSRFRKKGSELATMLSSLITRGDVSDPMSGFFMIRRQIIEQHAKVLGGEGYKLLLDILWTTGKSLKVHEVPYSFRERLHGQSKLDSLVAVDFLGLLFSKLSGGWLPVRFLMFAAVGVSGIAVHLAALYLALSGMGLDFFWSQIIAVVSAMTWNFLVNNRLTYRDKRLKGWRVASGLALFYVSCSVGAISNVGVASWIYSFQQTAWLAGIAGAVVGSVFNYAVSSTLIWKKR